MRCGKDNRHQRGWENLAGPLGVQVRTVRLHALHLAERGWIFLKGDTNAAGAHKAVEVWLRHCPVLGIVGHEVWPLVRNHAKASRGTVARSAHPIGVDARALNAPVLDDATALNAPVESDCRALNAPPSRYVGVDTEGDGYVGTRAEVEQ